MRKNLGGKAENVSQSNWKYEITQWIGLCFYISDSKNAEKNLHCPGKDWVFKEQGQNTVNL